MKQFSNVAIQREKCYKLVYKLPKDKRDMALTSLNVAEKWHKGQKRIEVGAPYIIHIYRVVAILISEFHIQDIELIVSGALHDVIEDSGISLREIEKMFGKNVAAIVKSESENHFRDREAYMNHFKYEPKKIRLLKLADRLDNLRTISSKVTWSKEKIMQYTIESERYMLPLAKSTDKATFIKMKNIILKLKTKNKEDYRRALKKGAYRDTERHKSSIVRR